MVNPVALITWLVPEATLQPTLENAPQAPDNSCNRGLVKLAPMALIVIVVLVVCATKRYQTSYRGVPQVMGKSLPYVDPTTVPVVLMHVVLELSKGAVAQVLPCAIRLTGDKITSSAKAV